MADEATTVVAQPPQAPAPETPAAPAAERPRDDKGRFTKENIERAAGLTVPATVPPEATTASVAPPVVSPAEPMAQAPATAPVAAAPPSIDDDLKAIDAIIGSTPVSEPPASPSSAPAPQAQPMPVLTPEQQHLDQIKANPAAAQALLSSAQAYSRLDQMLNNGNIQGFIGTMSPAVQEAMAEHFYQSNREQWSQRIVDEGNGVKTDPRVAMALRELSELKQNLTMQQTAEEAQRRASEENRLRQQLGQKLTSYIDTLFDSVKMKDSPNRVWLESALKQRIVTNPQAAQAIRAGNFGHVGAEFRKLWPEWKKLNAAPTVAPATTTVTSSTTNALMSTPAGTSVTAGSPQESLYDADGKPRGKGFVAAMKRFVKAG